MNQNFDNKIWKISRFEQSFLVILSLIFLTIATSFVVKIVAEEKIKATVAQINQQSKIAIKIEKQRFSFENFIYGKMDFKNISIRFLNSSLLTTRLSVKASLNPFSDNFATITDIQLGNTVINSNIIDVKSLIPANIQQNLHLSSKESDSTSSETEAETKAKGLIKRLMPFLNPDLRLSALIQHAFIQDKKNNRSFSLEQGKIEYRRPPNTLKLSSKQLNGTVKLINFNEVRYHVSSTPLKGLPWSQKGTLKLTKDQYVTASISGNGVPQALQQMMQLENKNSSYNIQATMVPRPDRFTQIKGQLSFSEFAIRNSLLAKKPLSSLASKVQFNTFLDMKQKEFIIKKAILELANSSTKNKKARGLKIAVSAKGVFSNSSSPYGVWNGFIKTPKTTCQRALDSIPDSFMPVKKGFELAGSLGFEGEFRFNSENPDRFFFQKSKSSFFGCRVTHSPFEYSAKRLGRPFVFKRAESDGSEISFNISPSTRFFTPIISVSKSTTTAIVASEDAGFWHHKGFEIGAIEAALRTNLRKNKIAVGGSTITMQTVKNLFLTPKRTISRKAQEIFLAWHLEKILPKDRILEIYLNIIEFGPKIYGIAHAAHHFFHKTPKALSLKESAFLASVLPSPIKRYRQFCRGALSQQYEMLMDKKLDQIHTLGQISFGTYLKTRAMPLVFASRPNHSSGRCRKVIAGLARPAHPTGTSAL